MMRKLVGYTFDKTRRAHALGGWGDETCGSFIMRGPTGKDLIIIASSGGGWDHVSVSLEKRAPYWIEIDFVKRLFFHDHEVVMQLHVSNADHINIHPNCLHLWRPQSPDAPIPLPPKWMV